MQSGPPLPPDPRTDLLLEPSQRVKSPPGCLGRGGCGIGCLAAILLVLLGLAPVASWLFAETRLIPSAGLIGPDTVAFAMVKLGEDDPGVRDLVNYVVVRLPIVQRGPLAGYHWPLQYGTEILPIHLVMTQDLPSSVPAAPPLPLPSTTFALCCSHTHGFNQLAFIHFKKYALEKGEVIERHRDREILSLDLAEGPSLVPAPAGVPSATGIASATPQAPASSASPTLVPARPAPAAQAAGETPRAWLAFVSNSFVMSSSLGAARTMIDRILTRSGTFKGTGALARMYERLNSTQDALGAVTGERGQIRRILEGIGRDEAARGTAAGPRITPEIIATASNGVSAVGYEVDILGSDRADVRVLVACQDDTTAQILRNYLDTLLTELEKSGLARKKTPARSYAVALAASPAEMGPRPPTQEWLVEARFLVLHVRRLLPLAPGGDASPSTGRASTN